MKKKTTRGLGPVGRLLIGSGITVAILGVLLTATLRHGLEPGLANVVGEKALPYVLFFTPVAIGVVGLILHQYLPKRLIFPLGIIGWIVGLSLIYWYFWFGPGAFGHH